jgi:hypothetical protein
MKAMKGEKRKEGKKNATKNMNDILPYGTPKYQAEA